MLDGGRNLRRRKADQVVFQMVHDLEKAAPYLKIIKECLRLTSDVNPAKKAFIQVMKIFDKTMEEGCEIIREDFNE